MCSGYSAIKEDGIKDDSFKLKEEGSLRKSALGPRRPLFYFSNSSTYFGRLRLAGAQITCSKRGES